MKHFILFLVLIGLLAINGERIILPENPVENDNGRVTQSYRIDITIEKDQEPKIYISKEGSGNGLRKSEPKLLDINREELLSKNYSDFVKTLANETVAKVVSHPLYMEIANGSLPNEKFRRFLIQDHWYIFEWYKTTAIDAAKETHPVRKRYFKSKTNPDYELFDHYYNLWNFTLDGNVKPYTKNYVDMIFTASKNGHPSDGFSAKFPCRLVWRMMSANILPIADLRNNPNHPYYQFLSGLEASLNKTTSIEYVTNLLDEYFIEADEPGKLKMLENWVIGVEKELELSNGIYNDNYN